ncbi:hypothetical protein V1260_15745 [Brachybacterium sp. J144]|uniref:hypothetical protein n=1 Tax=Brachybacterium sp. J144 TaxID=3116487 RepID=UPI002E764961|nr:hypothetical protein [Brachybacterium sp. J144]MEE1652231.1 hypothetical protein [Brachybacterium sp. J144]
MTHYLVTIAPDGTTTRVPYDPTAPAQIPNLIGTDITHSTEHPRGIEEIEILTDAYGHLLSRNSAPNPLASLYSGHPLTGRTVIAAHDPDTGETTGMTINVTHAVLQEIRTLIDLTTHTASP